MATSEQIVEDAAKSFVHSYYSNLIKSPENVHSFYKDKQQAVTSAAIFTRVHKFSYSVDANLTIGLGVHVLVMGNMVMEDNSSRNFSQFFVLAPLNKPRSYLIQNDVVRFHDEKPDLPKETIVAVQPSLQEVDKSNFDDDFPIIDNLLRRVVKKQGNR
ncbi:Ras GTPase-activating protein-binding protein [Corchorus capsularis]|uniref:Ras GTPase-activating protein-binding protein n=1 Tax=Corchorus capsularis TaxID=210143 RepID=A0A1R3IPR2_COCAP|nr:Ras GTPase-activating protein-binding protein [Corchorus capsularis]